MAADTSPSGQTALGVTKDLIGDAATPAPIKGRGHWQRRRLKMKNAPEGAFLLASWRSGRPTDPNSPNSSNAHLLSQIPNFYSSETPPYSNKVH